MKNHVIIHPAFVKMSILSYEFCFEIIGYKLYINQIISDYTFNKKVREKWNKLNIVSKNVYDVTNDKYSIYMLIFQHTQYALS